MDHLSQLRTVGPVNPTISACRDPAVRRPSSRTTRSSKKLNETKYGPRHSIALHFFKGLRSQATSLTSTRRRPFVAQPLGYVVEQEDDCWRSAVSFVTNRVCFRDRRLMQ